MSTTVPVGNEDGVGSDRALGRSLRDALALAVSKKVADQAFGRLATRRTVLGGATFPWPARGCYGTLLTYIWHQREPRNSPSDEPEVRTGGIPLLNVAERLKQYGYEQRNGQEQD